MNSKQLITLLVLLVVVGGAGLMLRKKQAASWEGANPSMGKKLLGEFPVNDVTQITIKQGTNQLDLAKTEELWRVRERNDYPANFSEISEFLLKAKDLKIVQTEKIGPSQLARLSLAPGEGTNSPMTVEFKGQGGKTIRTLVLGKKHMRKTKGPSPFGDMGGEEGYPDGRYVKVGESDSVSVISEPLNNIEPKPEQWLSKDFFKAEKIRSITVNFANGTNSWKLTREAESSEWKLVDAKPEEKLDVSKASGVTSPLSSPSFSDVATLASAAQYGLDKATVVNVDTFEDFSYTLKAGTKTNDNYPLTVEVAAQIAKERVPGKEEKAEDKDKLDKEFKEKQKKLEEKLEAEKAFSKWIYLVSSWSMESLLKDRSQLLAEKKDETKKDEGATAPAAIKLPGDEVSAPADDDKEAKEDEK